MKKRTISRMLTMTLSSAMITAQISAPVGVFAAESNDGDISNYSDDETESIDSLDIKMEEDVEYDEIDDVSLEVEEIIDRVGNVSDITADSEWLSDYEYIISEGFLIIKGYKGKSTELTIPARVVIDGAEYVVEVDSLESGEGAASRQSITKIVFGKGVYLGSYMSFKDMSALTDLDLSGVDTSGMACMDNMFRNCSNLKALDLSSFNTSNVSGTFDDIFTGVGGIGGMDSMFAGCSSITELDLSSFDTSGVRGMSNMFSGCTSLRSVNLQSFSTEKTCKLNGMFENCQNLTKLDLSNFDLQSAYHHILTGRGYTNTSGVVDMLKGSGVTSLKTPYNLRDNYEHVDYYEPAWNYKFDSGVSSGLPGEFVDQATGVVYTDLPCGEDGKVSHTLVRRTGNSNGDIIDDGKSNTFSKEDAIKGVTVIDGSHTLKLETDENGLFAGAKIVKADGTVDTNVNSYIANIVTKYAADGTPEEFYSLIFRKGVWDTSYDTVKDGLYSFRGEQYSVAGGTVNLNVNSLTYTGDIDGWKYIILGHVVKNHAGLVAYGPADDLHWFWIDDEGGCDTQYNAIVKWNGADFLVHGGRLRTDYTGFTYDPQNTSIWYHITYGQVWGDGEITDISIEGGTITRNVVDGVVQ